MPNPKSAMDLLEAAKRAYKAKFTPGFYHGSASNKIKEFDPYHKPSPQGSSSWDDTQTPLGVTFVSPSPKFAESFLPINSKTSYVNPPFKSGATMYPVSVNLGKHFDYENPEVHKLIEKYADNKILADMLKSGDWASMENPNFLKLLREHGYDTFATREGGVKNIGIFNPKNIRGKFAEYNPEHAESADFMKAEGGAINPIKTPREMLLELANFPHMADGRQVIKAGTEMKRLVEEAIQKYIRIYKKAPSPEDVRALEAHAAAISQKPTIWHDPVTQARARHELATNPGLMNPEDVRDPFLTQAMTGRGVKGTRQAPFVADINDPNLQKSLDVKQSAGHLEDLVGPEGVPSVTPAADALARMASSLEQRALSSGDIPLIDKIKMAFVNKNKRQPTEEELQVLIAEYNPMRHQYGNLGASIVTARPKTAKGMQDWRQRARTEGVPESYLEHRAGNYPQSLQAELQISKGIQPGIRPMSDDLITNPNREYADGRSVAALSPRDMEAAMAVHGGTPSRFDAARHRAAPETRVEKILRRANAPFAAMSAMSAGEKMSEGDPLSAALHGASAVGSGMASTRKLFKPGLGVVGAASVPLSIEEAISRYNRGDRTGAVLSIIQAAAGAAQMYPPTAVPGTLLGLGAAGVDALRDQPQYKSVMEEQQ